MGRGEIGVTSRQQEKINQNKENMKKPHEQLLFGNSIETHKREFEGRLPAMLDKALVVMGQKQKHSNVKYNKFT